MQKGAPTHTHADNLGFKVDSLFILKQEWFSVLCWGVCIINWTKQSVATIPPFVVRRKPATVMILKCKVQIISV